MKVNYSFCAGLWSTALLAHSDLWCISLYTAAAYWAFSLVSESLWTLEMVVPVWTSQSISSSDAYNQSHWNYLSFPFWCTMLQHVEDNLLEYIRLLLCGWLICCFVRFRVSCWALYLKTIRNTGSSGPPCLGTEASGKAVGNVLQNSQMWPVASSAEPGGATKGSEPRLGNNLICRFQIFVSSKFDYLLLAAQQFNWMSTECHFF